MRFRILILIMLFCSAAMAGEISDEIVRSDHNLNRLKGMIQAEQGEVIKLQDEKQKKARELKKAELELKYNTSLTSKLENKLLNLKKDLSFMNFQQKKLTDRQKTLEESIRSANHYLAGAGETELLEALILSDELNELTAGLQIIARVNSRLFDMVQELADNKNRLEENREKLNKSKKEMELALADRNESLKELEAKKTLVKQLYKMASEDEKIQKEYIRLLEEKQQELEKKIKELELAQIKQGEQRKFDGLGKSFSQLAKKLEWPIKGTIIESFGTKKVAEFKGIVHKKGIKIQPRETQVASVYDGVVMHTDTAWGLGWFVIVEHYGGYYTLYANLDEITVNKDQKVHSGEVLGTIDIDRPANTPYLYFEIRIHDKAVDPMGWLSS